MPLEIERRFLVATDGWRDHVAWVAELQQGYLVQRNDGLTIRIRVQYQLNQAPQSWLTIKAVPGAAAPASARLEFEYAIPLADAMDLLSQAPWRVEKCRHGLRLPDGDWVLDVFGGDNAPLMIAEVELQHPEDPVAIPSWCGQEITGLHQLSNAALACHPLASWTRADHEAIGDALKDASHFQG